MSEIRFEGDQERREWSTAYDAAVLGLCAMPSACKKIADIARDLADEKVRLIRERAVARSAYR